MRLRRVWFRLLCGAGAVALACLPALAGQVGTIVVDGDLSGPNDWGVSAPTGVDGNNWAPTQGTWVSEDSSSGGFVGPLFGGQNFDVEAMYTGFNLSTNMLYVAFVTGFDLEGERSGGANYYVGDLFIDFGYNDNTPLVGEVLPHSWDLAFDISSSAWDAADPSLASSTIASVDTTVAAVGAPSYDPTPVTPPGGYNSGAYRQNGGSNAGTASFSYTAGATIGSAWANHNVYEFGYHVTDANWLDQIRGVNGGLGWTVHWTMSCGNDVLEVGAAPVPVPAAAPIALLGMGIVALVSRKRRTIDC